MAVRHAGGETWTIANPFMERSIDAWRESARRGLGRPLEMHDNFRPDGSGAAYDEVDAVLRARLALAMRRHNERQRNMQRLMRPFDRREIENERAEWYLVHEREVDDARRAMRYAVRQSADVSLEDRRETIQRFDERLDAVGARNPLLWQRPAGFATRQGQPGFHEEFGARMLEAFGKLGINPFAADTRFVCQELAMPAWHERPVLQPYQLTCKYMCTPEFESVIDRFLVVHQLGTGKTLTMLEILDNFYDDPRPKVLVVPGAAQAHKLLQELCKWKTRFRDFAEAMLNRDTVQRAGVGDKVALGRVRDVLQVSNMNASNAQASNGLRMRAPLRILTYNEAGTQAQQPTGAQRILLKGRDWTNPVALRAPDRHFSQKIVLMDECQNFLEKQARFTAAELKFSYDNLVSIQRKVKEARDSCVYSFTATPIIDDPRDTVELLAAVTGRAGGNREGFVSHFMARPRALFAELTPMAAPDPLHPALRVVPLTGRPLQQLLADKGYAVAVDVPGQRVSLTRRAPSKVTARTVEMRSHVPKRERELLSEAPMRRIVAAARAGGAGGDDRRRRELLAIARDAVPKMLAMCEGIFQGLDTGEPGIPKTLLLMDGNYAQTMQHLLRALSH